MSEIKLSLKEHTKIKEKSCENVHGCSKMKMQLQKKNILASCEPFFNISQKTRVGRKRTGSVVH